MTAVIGAASAESIARWQFAWQWNPSLVAAVAVAAVLAAVSFMPRGQRDRGRWLAAGAARIVSIGLVVAMLSGLRIDARSGMPAVDASPSVPSLAVRSPGIVRLGDIVGIDVEAVLPPAAPPTAPPTVLGRRPVAELLDLNGGGENGSGAGHPIASSSLREEASGDEASRERSGTAAVTAPAGVRQPPRERRVHGRISWRPESAGTVTAAVRIRGEATPASVPVTVRVVDEPLRVIVLDRPRFESRFLSRLLERDGRSQVELRMIAAGPAADDAVGIPSTREAWNRFDVVVIGAIDPDLIGGEAADALVEAAVNDGVGILWSLDAASDPEAIAVAPIGRLLPFRGRSGNPPFTSPWAVSLTPSGGRTAWLSVADDDAASREAWRSMPAVYSPIRPSAIRPTARVMATCRPAAMSPGSGDRESPFILIDRAGASRVVAFLAETWRLRQGARGSIVDRLLAQAMLHAAEPHLASRLLDGTTTAVSRDGAAALHGAEPRRGPAIFPSAGPAADDFPRPLWNHPAVLLGLLAACVFEWWTRGRLGEGP